jgi:hypothetical protein
MKRISSDLLIGGVIVAVGVIALLQNLGVFGPAEDLIWATLFAAGGIAFLSAVAQDRARWWAMIPGAVLLSLGVLIAVSALAPALAVWGGTIFLGGIGLGFWGVYLLRRDFWWAIIPGGVLVTLGVVAGIGDRFADAVGGAIFFFGLAATFALVALLPIGSGLPRRWALIPAGVLFALALLVLTNVPILMNIVGPALLIFFGLALLYRALTHRKDEVRHDDQTVPQPH